MRITIPGWSAAIDAEPGTEMDFQEIDLQMVEGDLSICVGNLELHVDGRDILTAVKALVVGPLAFKD